MHLIGRVITAKKKGKQSFTGRRIIKAVKNGGK